ncbi:MAG: hypothetical protein KGR46_07655 [Verrucomicrobia bacterium]|nr:hypothetical protein [Verrucomicrobiota bacterium]
MTTHELAEQAGTRYVNQEGAYKCKVKEPGNGWFGKSPKKQTPFIRIPVRVDDPASPQHGREVVWQGWLNSRENMVKVKERLDEAFGIDWTWDSLKDGRSSFAGKRCMVGVKDEPYEGKPMFKAVWLKPVDGEVEESPGALPKHEVDELVESLMAATAPKPTEEDPGF